MFEKYKKGKEMKEIKELFTSVHGKICKYVKKIRSFDIVIDNNAMELYCIGLKDTIDTIDMLVTQKVLRSKHSTEAKVVKEAYMTLGNNQYWKYDAKIRW